MALAWFELPGINRTVSPTSHTHDLLVQRTQAQVLICGTPKFYLMAPALSLTRVSNSVIYYFRVSSVTRSRCDSDFDAAAGCGL